MADRSTWRRPTTTATPARAAASQVRIGRAPPCVCNYAGCVVMQQVGALPRACAILPGAWRCSKWARPPVRVQSCRVCGDAASGRAPLCVCMCLQGAWRCSMWAQHQAQWVTPLPAAAAAGAPALPPLSGHMWYTQQGFRALNQVGSRMRACIFGHWIRAACRAPTDQAPADNASRPGEAWGKKVEGQAGCAPALALSLASAFTVYLLTGHLQQLDIAAHHGVADVPSKGHDPAITRTAWQQHSKM